MIFSITPITGFFQVGLGFYLAVCLMGPGAHAVSTCGNENGAYQKEILSKVQAGIPFELMSAVFLEKNLISKKVIRISYNLWDEVVTLENLDQGVKKLPLEKSLDEICSLLQIRTSDLGPGKKYVFKLLLNPMWSERITRLKISTAGELENRRLVDVNWKRISEEMSSEKVLFETELLP